MADVGAMSLLAVGRKYGVSDNAVRKWIRWYEYQAARQEYEEARRRDRDAVDGDDLAA
jgi:transposase-like protein